MSAGLEASTVTPGMTPLLASRTTPAIACAKAALSPMTAAASARTATLANLTMAPPENRSTDARILAQWLHTRNGFLIVRMSNARDSGLGTGDSGLGILTRGLSPEHRIPSCVLSLLKSSLCPYYIHSPW